VAFIISNISIIFRDLNPKSTQSQSDGHLPYYSSLYYLARALDAWRGMWNSCAVRMRRNN